MALVRCQIHKIPYNDENPRGCPACARESEGADQLGVMQELAKATRSSQAVSTQQPPPAGQIEQPEKELAAGALWRQSLEQAQAPIIFESSEAATVAEPRFAWLAEGRRKLTIGWIIIAVLAIAVVLTSGPQYVEALHPPEPPAQPRLLTVDPFAPITTLFSILGPQEPQAVTEVRQIARYSYGSDLYIDALNRRVYAITLEVGSRTWAGLQVGMPERTVEGTLARLGTVQRQDPVGARPPQLISGYSVFPSLEDRPRRTLLVEVRPPNGCYDVAVDLQPQAVGILRAGNERYAVIGDGSDAPLVWVATRIRITTRRTSGPYATVVC